MNPVRSFLAAVATLLAAFLLATPVFAQTPNYTTTITLTKLLANGSAVPYGLVCAQPADAYGNPISVSAPTWGFILANNPMCANVASGAITGGLPVPDSAHTDAAAPIYYDITIQKTTSSGTPIGQVIQLNAVPGITGATWALDSYVPAVSVPVTPSNALGYGTAAPGSCTAPSLYTTPSGSLYSCANGVYNLVTGGGSSPSGSLVLQGVWNSGTAYALGAVVSVGSTNYISLVASNQNNNPTTSPTFWYSMGAPLTAAAVANAISTQTGCSTAGYVWSPNTNTCVAQPSSTAASIAALIVTQTGCSTAGDVWSPQSNTCLAPASVSATSVASAISTQTGCSTVGYVWSPQSNTCLAQTPAPTAASVDSLITSQTGCSTAGYVWSPQSNTCVAQAAGTFGTTQAEVSTPSAPATVNTLIPYIATDDTLKTTAADGVTSTTVKSSASVANQWVTAINPDGSVSRAAISSLQLSDVAYNLGSITKYANLPPAANYYNSGTSTGRFAFVTDCSTSACTAGGGTIMGVLQAAANGTWTVIEALNYSTGSSSITFPTGLLYGANSTNAPTAATSAQILAAIGSVPNANLASQTANTVLGAATATTPTGLVMPSCSSGSNALTWVSGTGFGCNTISGSGTVNSGTTYSVPYYSGSTAVSGVSITGIPYFSNSAAPAAATSAQVTALVSALPASSLASQAANTILGSTTAASPSALAVPSCSGSTNALTWISGTGFVCNTSIAANTAATAGNVSGTPALPNGVTATTQTAGDTSTKLATDAFATAAAAAAATASDPVGTAALLTSGTTMVSPASVALGATATNIFPTYTLPANALGVGRCLLITGSMGHTGSHTWTPVLNIGSFTATIWSTTDTTTWQFEARFCNTTSTSNNYFIPWILGNYAGTGFSLNFDGWGTGPTATTINTTAAVPISITATGTSGDNAGGIYLSIQVI